MHDGTSRSPLLMRVSQSLLDGLRLTIAITRFVIGKLPGESFRSCQTLRRSSSTRSTGSTLLSVNSFDDQNQVQRFIETPALGLDVAFDVRGTPFQRRVWTVLQGGPAVRFHHNLRRARLPHRRAGRGACSRPRVRAKRDRAWYLVPPRHSTARSGYRWGVERKRALLAREGA
jgi:O6-methylguanine-DNA--protein-cysteine methyltransferase